MKKIVEVVDDKIEKTEKYFKRCCNDQKVFEKSNSKNKLLKLHYFGPKNFFIQQMCLYATNKLSSILDVVGYRIGRKRQDIFVKDKEKGSLESYQKNNKNKKIGKIHGLIIAYGIACAMELLHSHQIVHRNLKPGVILLDERFHIYLSEFYYARQVQVDYEYSLKMGTPEFIKTLSRLTSSLSALHSSASFLEKILSPN